LIENFYRKKQNEGGDLPIINQAGLYDLTKHLGVSLLTDPDRDAMTVCHDCKTRWDNEEMFDHHNAFQLPLYIDHFCFQI
jgi:hypothetical protein